MGEFVKAANTNEIAPGQGRLVSIKGEEIALFNVGEFSLPSKMPARMKRGHQPREKSRHTR
jgi:hypothetical protein